MTSLQKQDQSVQELSSKMEKNFAGLTEKLDSYIGKKHVLKRIYQFALFVPFHEIFVTKIMNKYIILLFLKQKIREIAQLGTNMIF